MAGNEILDIRGEVHEASGEHVVTTWMKLVVRPAEDPADSPAAENPAAENPADESRAPAETAPEAAPEPVAAAAKSDTAGGEA